MADKMASPRRRFLAHSMGIALTGLYGCGGIDRTDAGDTATTSSGAAASSASSSSAAASGSSVIGASGSASTRQFVHPGLLHTEADFARMRAKVVVSAQPWLDGWNRLTSNGRAQLGTAPRPLAVVTRSSALNNTAQLYIDIDRAYQLALRWQVTGSTTYADAAVGFLDAWSSTLTEVTGDADRYLAAGIYGYQFANVGEIMRTYSGWAAADFVRFQELILNVFYPLSSRFLREHNDAVITNYWANWDQCALACVLATGVLCDRPDIYQEALDYYKFGQGNGASLQAVYHVHPGNLGQWQESGRDQGHSTLGIGLAGAFCEMAWNQGDDMYGWDNNRFLAGAEYVAKCNLKDDVGNFYTLPFFTLINRQGTFTGVSPAGLGSVRPVWESVYHHYAGRKGIAAPWVARQVAQLRPEGDGGNGDQLGMGTLTYPRDPAASGQPPSGLTAWRRGQEVSLSWWGTADASSYNVKRAIAPAGPFSTIATGISGTLTFTDTNLTLGSSYYYVITALAGASESAPSTSTRVVITPELLLHLPFSESAGDTASDASGHWPAAKLVETIHASAPSAVVLDGINDHIVLPDALTAQLADCSIACRVWLDENRTWSRVFDFGSGERRWMMLTPRASNGVVRFSINAMHGYVTQEINGTSALPVGSWVHVAITLSGPLGILYVDGVEAGRNESMSLAPFMLGPSGQNYLGRSQYASDPYLKGKLRDFRVYHGALSDTQMRTLSLAE